LEIVESIQNKVVIVDSIRLREPELFAMRSAFS